MHCDIDDIQITKLAEILKENNNLTNLNLAHNNITNKGAQNIASMLQKEGLTIDLRFQNRAEVFGYEEITSNTPNLFNPTNILFKNVAVVKPQFEYGEEGKH